MLFTTLILILFSGFCHATWNIIAKRATDKFTFLWLQMIVNVLLLGFPILSSIQIPDKKSLPLILCSGILQTAYYLLLAKTYSIGDISIVYPLTRGSAPVFVAFISFLFGLEHITLPVFLSILMIVFGIYTVNLQSIDRDALLAPFRFLVKSPSANLSLVLGMVIAVYTIVDKQNVSNTSPFMVFYLITVVPMILLSPFIIRRGKIKQELLTNKGRIIIVAVLTFLAYVLILIAMQKSTASFISPVREISIVFVAIYSAITVKEKNWKPKVIGSVSIFTGIILLSVFSAMSQ